MIGKATAIQVNVPAATNGIATPSATRASAGKWAGRSLSLRKIVARAAFASGIM